MCRNPLFLRISYRFIYHKRLSSIFPLVITRRETYEKWPQCKLNRHVFPFVTKTPITPGNKKEKKQRSYGTTTVKKKTDHIVQRQGICEKNQENTTANKRKEFSQTNFVALYRSIDKWTTKRLQTYDKTHHRVSSWKVFFTIMKVLTKIFRCM